MHIILPVVAFLDCVKPVCGRTGACGPDSEAPALDLPSWGHPLVKQFMTWRTKRPGSDHRAVWTEPDPEHWNRGGPPGFFLLQSILGRTWPSLQPAHITAFDTDDSKKRQAVYFLSSKTSSQTKSRHLSICSFRK